MNMKKLVYILISVVLISFGIGALSLRYNDGFRFGDIRFDTITIDNNKSNKVKIGSSGIEVKDSDDHVSIGWDGIKVDDGSGSVSIGWDGINIREGNKPKKSIKSWFNFNRDLKWITIDQEELLEIDGLKNINIASTFVDVKLSPIDGDQVKVKFSGDMQTNVVPELSTKESLDEIEIKIEEDNKNSYIVDSSNVVLEVFIPNQYSGNLSVEGSSSDIDIKDITIENLKASSSSGDIYIANISRGILNIKSSSGNIKIKKSIAEIQATSSSGDINIKNSIGKIQLKSSSGNIELDNKQNNEDIKVSSNSGDINIEFSKNSNYIINGTSLSGGFKSSFPIDIREGNNNGKEVKGLLGSGENTIEVNTSSGDFVFSGD